MRAGIRRAVTMVLKEWPATADLDDGPRRWAVTMGRDGGFTLLETLAAFVIAALALAALTQGVGGGLRATRVAAHTQEALSRARSHLAAAALAPVPGEQRGDDGGGYAWRVTTARLLTLPPVRGGSVDGGGAGGGGAGNAGSGSAAGVNAGGGGAGGGGRPGAALYAIRAVVSWSLDGGAREVALDTQRVGPVPLPDAP